MKLVQFNKAKIVIKFYWVAPNLTQIAMDCTQKLVCLTHKISRTLSLCGRILCPYITLGEPLLMLNFKDDSERNIIYRQNT